jgi:Na+-transporting methylmalonyl-CoA/oxaloacetate decarboxylase gamma subunit
MNNLSTSLLITLIGMGLVFVGILLLWGVMEWLVRATSDRQPVVDEMNVDVPAPGAEFNRKRAAAAAAVSFALAMQRKNTTVLVLNNLEESHNWQAVMRANQLNGVCQFSLRKPQGK